MSEFIIAITGPYGGIDLKKNYRKYMTIALSIAVGIHLLGLLSYVIAAKLSEEDEPTITVRILKYSELGPPPSLQSDAAPAIAVSGPAVKPTIGIPIPVPDAEVSPEQTIASQTDLANQGALTGDGSGPAQIEQDVKIEDEKKQELNLDDGPPPEFVAYEDAPTPIKQVMPKYPDIALRAELEGVVYVNLWVTKEGKVKKAKVVKSDAEVFNQAAMDAGMQWVFTPALQNKRPVDVWVTIPFRFRLKDVQR
jgi:periplasmic protein TonB